MTERRCACGGESVCLYMCAYILSHMFTGERVRGEKF